MAEEQRTPEPLSEFDEKVFESISKYLRDPLRHPKEYKTWLQSYFELNPPLLPISQIVGFSGFTPKTNEVGGSYQSTTSTTFTNLSTTGPTVSDLPPGTYAVFFGCTAYVDIAGKEALMSFAVNGSTQSETTIVAVTNAISVARLVLKTLTAPENTLLAKYAVSSGGTASFAARWLTALKVANA